MGNRASRILKIALEGEAEDKMITVKGPLGEAMTKALDIAYAKQDGVTGEANIDGAALESEQQDITIMDKLINGVNSHSDAELSEGVDIYALPEADVDSDTVVDVVNDMEESDASDYVVIADASAPGTHDGSGETVEVELDTSSEAVTAETESPAGDAANAEQSGTKIVTGDEENEVVELDDGEQVEVDDEMASAVESYGLSLEAVGAIKKGDFHKWLGKKEDAEITKKDIAKGLKSKDPHAKKMAQFAKNFSGKKKPKKDEKKGKTTKVAKKKAAVEALRLAVRGMGGKFFSSLEEYVESLEVPVVPENESGDAALPETGAGDGKQENGGADGTGPGRIDHVSEQIQENGSAQPGTGATKD